MKPLEVLQRRGTLETERWQTSLPQLHEHRGMRRGRGVLCLRFKANKEHFGEDSEDFLRAMLAEGPLSRLASLNALTKQLFLKTTPSLRFQSTRAGP